MAWEITLEHDYNFCGSYIDFTERNFLCKRTNNWAMLITCLRCKHYDKCEQITPEIRRAISRSVLVTTDINASKLLSGRADSYLFINRDGSIVTAYEGFTPVNPDWSLMQNVVQVLHVSKVLTKHVKLVSKPTEEQSRIRASLNKKQ